MAFDWASLITPAASLGAKALGDKVAPSADLQQVRNQQENQQFQNQLTQQKMAQSNQIRQMMMPGMFTNLGFSPQQGQQMAQRYGQTANAPVGGSGGNYGYTSGGAQPQQSGGSGLGTAAKVGLGVASVAPKAVASGLGALGGALGTFGGTSTSIGAGGLPATLTTAPSGLAGTLGALASNPATWAVGAGVLGAVLWRKSQAHPEANQWVQGEQNPFDESMAAIDQSQVSPEEKKQAKQQNAQRYLGELQKFAAQGGDKLQVARQAAQTFRQWYGDPAQYGVQLGF